MFVKVIAEKIQWTYTNAKQVYYEDGCVVVVTPDDIHGSVLVDHHFYDSELESIETKTGKTTWRWNKDKK